MSERKRKIKLSVSIPAAEIEKLRALGESMDRSWSWVVGKAIERVFAPWQECGKPAAYFGNDRG